MYFIVCLFVNNNNTFTEQNIVNLCITTCCRCEKSDIGNMLGSGSRIYAAKCKL